MRRVLRHGGTLFIADFDKPLHRREMGVLRGAGYLYSPDTVAAHIDRTWAHLIEKAGFVGLKRVSTCSESIARVTIIRARRA